AWDRDVGRGVGGDRNVDVGASQVRLHGAGHRHHVDVRLPYFDANQSPVRADVQRGWACPGSGGRQAGHSEADGVRLEVDDDGIRCLRQSVMVVWGHLLFPSSCLITVLDVPGTLCGEGAPSTASTVPLSSVTVSVVITPHVSIPVGTPPCARHCSRMSAMA